MIAARWILDEKHLDISEYQINVACVKYSFAVSIDVCIFATVSWIRLRTQGKALLQALRAHIFPRKDLRYHVWSNIADRSVYICIDLHNEISFDDDILRMTFINISIEISHAYQSQRLFGTQLKNSVTLCIF